MSDENVEITRSTADIFSLLFKVERERKRIRVKRGNEIKAREGYRKGGKRVSKG
jgi:DNA invertase Pin-like site-specific DNA recombinase